MFHIHPDGVRSSGMGSIGKDVDRTLTAFEDFHRGWNPSPGSGFAAIMPASCMLAELNVIASIWAPRNWSWHRHAQLENGVLRSLARHIR